MNAAASLARPVAFVDAGREGGGHASHHLAHARCGLAMAARVAELKAASGSPPAA